MTSTAARQADSYSGCGKERRMFIVHDELPMQHSFETILRFSDLMPAETWQ